MLIAIALAASVVIGYMGITELAEVNINTQDITKRYLPSLQNILNADRDLYQAEIARKELIQAEPGSSSWGNYAADIEENYEQMIERVGAYAELAEPPEQKEAIAEHERAREVWKQHTDSYVNLSQGASEEELRTLRAKLE